MASRDDLEAWLQSALAALGGKAHVVEVCKEIWKTHGKEPQESVHLFYTWQYDIRWAANRLRRKKKMKPVEISPAGLRELL